MATTTDPMHGVRPDPVPAHSASRSLLLHLAPGAAMLVFYVAMAPLVMRWGFPPLFASLLTIPVILVPWMLGWLAYEAHRATGSWNPLGAVPYRPVPFRHTVVAAVALIAWGAVAFATAQNIGLAGYVQRGLTWLPAWFLNPADFDDIVAMSTGRLLIFLGSLLLLAGVVAPAVEELYFRGYLLPRLARFRAMAPVINVALFTIYHFESPWDNPVRFLVVLPLACVVWWRGDLRAAITAHVALNTLSALGLTAAVFAAR